ncbi:hypothetical protein [Janthinobacterium sp. B9-8]|uniref:hypothetical protein n=1 Tax=Janthinobacterium sp. B9-8 TaxID=1236179 RepID=UPI00061D2BEB|nr:hypothetical protein [Janthinobacterium sp. B9-8]AMC33479.1 hypothetical protein VN23_02120 [Janthinobacterium sp. B9-8]
MKATLALSILAAAVLSACGGGGGGSDTASGAASADVPLRMQGGGGACGNGCGGNSGGGSTGGGVGGGGGLSMMRNVVVSISKVDGTVLASADLTSGLVSIFPGTQAGPFIATFTPKANGEYFDEARREWVSLGTSSLRVLLPNLNSNFSANPFTEAAYQYAIKKAGSEAALTATSMQEANDYIKTEFNTKLAERNKITDITLLPTFIDDTKGLATLAATPAGRYGAVLSGLAFAAQAFNNKLTTPALAFTKQLVEDIKDNNKIDISITPSDLAYGADLAERLDASINQATTTWGGAELQTEVLSEVTPTTAALMAADGNAFMLSFLSDTNLFGNGSSGQGARLPSSKMAAGSLVPAGGASNVATAGVFACSSGGTRTVTVVDANNNHQLDQAGDMEKTVYANCNSGSSTQNGFEETGALSNVTFSSFYKLSGTLYYKKDTTTIGADNSSSVFQEDYTDETIQQVDANFVLQSLKGTKTLNSFSYLNKNSAGVVTYQEASQSAPGAVYTFDFTRQADGTYQGTTTQVWGKYSSLAETADKMERTATGNRSIVNGSNLFWSGWKSVTRNSKLTNYAHTMTAFGISINQKYDLALEDEILTFDGSFHQLTGQTTFSASRVDVTVTSPLGVTSQLVNNYKQTKNWQKDVSDTTSYTAESVRLVNALGTASISSVKSTQVIGLGTSNTGNNSFSLAGLLTTSKGYTFNVDSMVPDTKFTWTAADKIYPVSGDLRALGAKNSSLIIRAKGGNNMDVVYTTSTGQTGTIASRWK